MIKFVKKIRSASGETLVETLAALIVIILTLSMLAGSVVVAFKVNRKTEDASTEFVEATAAPVVKTVTVNGKDVKIDVYTTDENDYIYYSVDE